MSPRVIEGWTPREVHEHQDAEGNIVGWTVVHRESEWDDSTRERVFRLAAYERSLCPCGCGLLAEQTLDPYFEPWLVDSYTCYATRAVERIKRQWSEQHKGQPEGWGDGVVHYVVPADGAGHNAEAAAKAEEIRRRRTGGD